MEPFEVRELPPMLRQRDVVAAVGVCRATVWKWVRDGNFPRAREARAEFRCMARRRGRCVAKFTAARRVSVIGFCNCSKGRRPGMVSHPAVGTAVNRSCALAVAVRIILPDLPACRQNSIDRGLRVRMSRSRRKFRPDHGDRVTNP